MLGERDRNREREEKVSQLKNIRMQSHSLISDSKKISRGEDCGQFQKERRRIREL